MSSQPDILQAPLKLNENEKKRNKGKERKTQTPHDCIAQYAGSLPWLLVRSLNDCGILLSSQINTSSD